MHGNELARNDFGTTERRTAQYASAEDLLEYLESVSGRVFYNSQDISAWLADVRLRAAEERAASTSRKRVFMLVALLVAFLQYEVIDMMIQVNSLRASGITAPSTRPAAYRS